MGVDIIIFLSSSRRKSGRNVRVKNGHCCCIRVFNWLAAVITRHVVLFKSDIEMSCGFKYCSSVAFLMANANCAMNPSICFIFSRNYREGLKTLLREIINSAEVMILLYDNWEDQST